MRRIELYLSERQIEELTRRANDEGTSRAEVVSHLLDLGVRLEGNLEERLAAVRETAGIAADLPDWPEWLASVRRP